MALYYLFIIYPYGCVLGPLGTSFSLHLRNLCLEMDEEYNLTHLDYLFSK